MEKAMATLSSILGASQVALQVKVLPANSGDLTDVGSVSGLKKFSGGGHGNPLQYSCLQNPRNRGSWWATVYGIAQSQTQLTRLRNSSSRIPWREEPGRLQSKGSHRVGHNLSDFTYTQHTFYI